MRQYRRCIFCNQFALDKNIKDFIFDERRDAIKRGKIKTIYDGPKSPQANKDEYEAVVKRQRDFLMNWTCPHCGEQLTQASHHIRNEQGVINYGYALYEEFKKFANQPMPKEILIVGADDDRYLGRCDFNEEIGMFVISIQESEYIYFHNLKRLFFHEFCHILDHYNPDTGGKKIDPTGLNQPWYTEIHASEVEMKALLGFSNIDEDRKTRVNKKVIFNNRYVTLEQFMVKNAMIMLESISYQLENEGVNFELVITLIRSIAYFHGKINFCQHYVIGDIDKLRSYENELGQFITDKFSNNDAKFKRLMTELKTNCIGLASNYDESYLNTLLYHMLVVLLYQSVPDSIRSMYKIYKTIQ